MSKSRLSALLRKNLGLESERPLDAAGAVETPAAVAETRAAETPVAEAPVSETPVETPVVAAEKLVVFHTSNESEETAPAAETPVAVVEPGVAEEPIVPATTEEPAAVPAEDGTAVSVVNGDGTVSTEGWGGAIKNYLLNTAAVIGGQVTGGLAGTVAGGPVGTLTGYAIGGLGAHTAWSRATAKKALVLKKQIEDISNRIADAKNGDLTQAKKKGAKLKAIEDVKIDGEEVLKRTLMGFFIPFYNAYYGHKAEELQKQLDKKLGELKIVLETKGIATESLIQLSAGLESEGADLELTAEEAAATMPEEEIPATPEETTNAETPVVETPVVATEGEGEEVIQQTPAEDTAQGEAEQAAERAADQAAQIPATAEVVPTVKPAADVAQPTAAVSTEDDAIEKPVAVAGETPAETPVEQAAEQVEQVEQAAAKVVAENAAPAAAEVPAAITDAPAPVEASTEDGVPAELVSGEEPVVTATEPEAAAQPEDDSAHTFVGVIEADHEIADQAQSLESLVEIADGLNAIAVSLESAIQEGGLQPQAAAMMNLAVQAHTSRLGISQPVTASLENYGGMSARTHATKISLEGVEEVAKQVWETIKQVAATLWKSMVEFAKKIFAASTWVKEQAEKLGERYKAAKGEAKSKELTLKAGLASRLAVDGKVVGKVSQALHDIVTVAFDTVEYDKAGLKAIEHERQSIIDALQSGDAEAAAKIFAENDPVLPKTFSRSNGDTHSTQPVAGGVAFTMQKKTKEAAGVTCTFYYAGKEKSEHVLAEDVQIRTPDLHEIGQILEVCKMVVSVGEAVEGMGQALEEEAKKVNHDHADLSNLKESFKSSMVVAMYRDRASQLNRASSLVMGHLVTTTRAALHVVDQALGEYETAQAA